MTDFAAWLAEIATVAPHLGTGDIARLLCVDASTVYRWRTGDIECPGDLAQLAGLYLALSLDVQLAELAADGNRRAFVARVRRVVEDPVLSAARARMERAVFDGARFGKWTNGNA